MRPSMAIVAVLASLLIVTAEAQQQEQEGRICSPIRRSAKEADTHEWLRACNQPFSPFVFSPPPGVY